MRRLLILLGLAFSVGQGLAQVPIQQADSFSIALKGHPAEDTIRVKLLIDLIKAFIYDAPEDAMKYPNEVIRISEKIKWGSGTAFGNRYKGLFIISTEIMLPPWIICNDHSRPPIPCTASVLT